MFPENWHFNSRYVLKTTKIPVFFFSLLRFFEELFDVINDDPFLTLLQLIGFVPGKNKELDFGNNIYLRIILYW